MIDLPNDADRYYKKVTVYNDGNGNVEIYSRETTYSACANAVDLIAAIQTEMGISPVPAVFDDLPDVSTHPKDTDGEYFIFGQYFGTTDTEADVLLAEVRRGYALYLRILAEQRSPKVDEAQVEALATLLNEIGGPTLGGGTTPLPDVFARRVLESGKVTVTL